MAEWETRIEDLGSGDWMPISTPALLQVLQRAGYNPYEKMSNIESRAALGGEAVEVPGISGPFTVWIRRLTTE
jgi:hypothetical protein